MRYVFFDENGRVSQAINDETVNELPQYAIQVSETQFQSRFDLLLVDGVLTVSPPLPEPVPLEKQFEAVRHALQAEIDSKAIILGFSDGNVLMLYAGFDNPFQPLAQGFAVWEAGVWLEAGTFKQSVIDGDEAMITPAEAVAMMPEYTTG